MKAKDYIIIAGAIAVYLLWKNNKKKKESGLDQPTGMDLPILTAGTGVPTEVAIQLGGIKTAPQPIKSQMQVLETEESLGLGGIKPIVKGNVKTSTIPEVSELP
jgi:hypothetical protein